MCDDTDEVDDSETPDTPERTGSSAGTVRHDWSRSPQPSVLIVEAVAAATDRRPTDLPPLQKTIDADALDTLLDGRPPNVTISFRYAGTTISVNGDGNMDIHVDGARSAGDDG
jgi:hypothetical protein